MLDLTSVVQTASGVGATPSTVVTLPSGTTEDNGVFIGVLHDAGNFVSSFPAGFDFFSAGGGSSPLHLDTMCKDATAGETTWTVTMGGTGAPCIWFAMELTGGMSMSTRNPEWISYSLCWDLYVNVFAGAGPASTVDTGASSNAPTIWGDGLFFAFVSAYRAAAGAPPTVTGAVVHTVDTSLPAWSALCATTVTTAGSNNIRLDVYYSVAGGRLGSWSAKPTWTASTDLVVAYITGCRGFFDPPQKTLGRASTNSMT